MEAKKCSHHRCELEVYEDSDKCVLHCEKSNEYKHEDIKLYNDFNKALILNIAEQLESSSNNDDVIIDKQSAIHILNGKSFEEVFSVEAIRDMAKNTFNNIINFSYIIFPPRKDKGTFDYELTLRKLKAMQFNFCQFNTNNLLLDNITCFFSDCIFINDWSCPPCLKWGGQENIYQSCTFKGNVSNYSSEDRNEMFSTYSVPLFDYFCTFKGNIEFENVKFKKPFFYSSVEQNIKKKKVIKKIYFKDCIFEDIFKLNNFKICDFSCKDTVFTKKSKFEFKNNVVNDFEIKNSNFKVLVDCFETKFKSFKIEKSIFEKFTAFENCAFGEKGNADNIAIFKYATFLDFITFRESSFYNGLDFQKTNLKDYPNFLDIYVELKNTNRETFRIIKHSFDKVGNNIEANKFFAYEMNKEREDTKFKKSPSKWLALQFNHFISDFGQSFLFPLGLIIYFLCLQFLVFCLVDSYKIDEGYLRDFWIGLNHTIHNFIPFKKFLVEGKEFISLMFLIIYSTLIYNFVVAVKRITKR